MEAATSRKEEIDLLIRQLPILKSDQIMQASSFKNHTRISQIILAGLSTFLGLLFTDSSYSLRSSTVNMWLIVSLLLVSIVYYLAYDTLEANFAVHALAKQMSRTERRINELAGKQILLWDSAIAPSLWNPPQPTPKVWHPIWFMTFYQMVLTLLISLVFPIYVSWSIWILPNRDLWRSVAVVSLIVYALTSFLVFVAVWIGVNRYLPDGVDRLIESRIQRHVVESQN